MNDAGNRNGKSRIIVLVFLTAMAVLLITLLDTPDAGGEEYVVDQGGGGDYTTVTGAVDSATSGDTVYIRNGSYAIGDLSNYLKSGVSLIGEDKNNTRLLFQSPLDSLIIIMRYDVRFENLNFTSIHPDHSNIIKLFGVDTSMVNCSFNNVHIQFEMGFTLLFPGMNNGIIFSGNHLWNSKFSFHGPVNLNSQSEDLRPDILRSDLRFFRSYVVEDNSFNGRPLTYLTNASDLEIQSAGGGIILINCTNISIDSAVFPSRCNGILLMECSDVTINNTSFLSSTNLVSSWLSSNIVIRNSIIGDPLSSISPPHPTTPVSSTSLLSLYSKGLVLQNNSIRSNITIEGDIEPIISNNSFLGPNGLTFSSVTNAGCTGNTFQEKGLEIVVDDSDQPLAHFEHTVEENLVNGKPITYLLKASNETVPSDSAQVFLVNSTNISCTGLHITNVSQAILLFGTTGSTIADSKLVDNGEGILLSYSDGNVIENCQVQGSSLALVTVESSDNRMSNCSFLNGTLTMQGERNLLEHCDVVYGTGGKGYHGIITEGDLIMFHSLVNGFRTGILVESGNLDIMWSRITHNIDGIQLEAGTLLNAYDCDIVENQGTGIVSRNPQQIIIRQSRILYNLEDGVELGGVSSKISDSSMEFNGKSGVHVTGSECEISDSMITNNSVSGIGMENAYLLSFSNCTIRDNRNGISGFASSGYLISNSSILHNEQNGFFTSEGSGGIVEYSTISGSINGIRLERTTAEIRWCTITDNTNGIYAYRPTSNVTVSHCTIMNNSEFGIGTQLYNAFTVNASHNYWGFPSGPFHSEENPDGRGNPIGDEVAFSPWYEDDQFDVFRYLEKKEDDDSGSDDADVIIFTIFIIVIPFLVMGIRVMKRRKQPGAVVVAAPPRKPGKNVKVVPEGLKLATVTSRIVASAFDGVIIVFILLLIFVSLLLETESADTFCGLMVAIYLIVPIEYFLFTEMEKGQSYGKNWARIRLVSIDGNPVSLSQTVRSALSKGFLYPFLNIVDAITGIFFTHKKTLQRISQDYAGLIVVTVREKRGKSDAAERPGIKHNGGDA